MSDRERWTVYPLLFLALGVSLRSSGKFGPTKDISCQHLEIAGPDGDVRIMLSAAPDAGSGGSVLKVTSGGGRGGIELCAAPQGAAVKAIGANGQAQVVLETTPNGGVLASLAPDGRRLTLVEPTPLGGAVFTFDPRGQAHVLFGIPVNSNRPRSAGATGEESPGEAGEHATPENGQPGAEPAAGGDAPAESSDTKPAEPAGDALPPSETAPEEKRPPEEKPASAPTEPGSN